MNTKSAREISFYIVAHADDWQLFMQPNAYKDLLSENKVVYVMITAGDGGETEKYWRAREEGLKSSIRFCLAPREPLTELSECTQKFNGHDISYSSLNNAKCDFLRLPDGNLDGSGYEKNDFQSITKLKSGSINFIDVVDVTTRYASWFDLCKTLEEIIQAESLDISTIWINYLNPDQNLNPEDHADHKATGEAIQAMSSIANMNQTLFEGYNLFNNTVILNQPDYFLKVAMFAAYEKSVFDISGYSTLKENLDMYLEWCSRSSKFITILSTVGER